MTKTGTATLATAITGFVASVLALLVAFGVPLDAAQQAAILGVVGAVLMLSAAVLASRGMDKSRVVEQLTPSGKVLAGEANELPTGSRIRDLGSLVKPQVIKAEQVTVATTDTDLVPVGGDDADPFEPVD